jgi:hypothetical protein
MNDKQIMVIEDNPDDRDLTIRALKENIILNPVTVASNGAEALTILPGDDHHDQVPVRVACVQQRRPATVVIQAHGQGGSAAMNSPASPASLSAAAANTLAGPIWGSPASSRTASRVRPATLAVRNAETCGDRPPARASTAAFSLGQLGKPCSRAMVSSAMASMTAAGSRGATELAIRPSAAVPPSRALSRSSLAWQRSCRRSGRSAIEATISL